MNKLVNQRQLTYICNVMFFNENKSRIKHFDFILTTNTKYIWMNNSYKKNFVWSKNHDYDFSMSLFFWVEQAMKNVHFEELLWLLRVLYFSEEIERSFLDILIRKSSEYYIHFYALILSKFFSFILFFFEFSFFFSFSWILLF